MNEGGSASTYSIQDDNSYVLYVTKDIQQSNFQLWKNAAEHSLTANIREYDQIDGLLCIICEKLTPIYTFKPESIQGYMDIFRRAN